MSGDLSSALAGFLVVIGITLGHCTGLLHGLRKLMDARIENRKLQRELSAAQENITALIQSLSKSGAGDADADYHDGALPESVKRPVKKKRSSLAKEDHRGIKGTYTMPGIPPPPVVSNAASGDCISDFPD